MHMLPPKGGSKSEFVGFVNKIQLISNKVCYKVFLCSIQLRQAACVDCKAASVIGLKHGSSDHVECIVKQ